MSGEEVQEGDKFNYLGEIISTDGGMEEEVAHRVLEGRKVWRTMAKLFKQKMISRENEKWGTKMT